MVLDTIIELESKFIKNKKRNPTILKLNYATYRVLIKELEQDYFIDQLHGMKLKIVETKKIELE